jgi:Zn-dependent membrane protease YugP
VEFDASRRALAWLNRSGLTGGAQQKGAEEALRAAAMTYVAAALSSLVTLLYYVSIYLGGRRRD